MVPIAVTDAWKTAHPGAFIGVLEISEADNSSPSDALNREKRSVEERLRAQYAGYSRQQFLALPVIAAYDAYYKRFEKTYHVQLQLESLVLKGKNLPNVSPLVEANFAAEVETLVLTAGHHVAKLRGSLRIDSSRAGESFTQMNGAVKEIRAGDMVMRDDEGICCTIIYGQDNRSPISKETKHALYVAYAPPGVGQKAVLSQLDGIERYVRLFAPHARTEQKAALSA
jgi:DNA/RNA-binding domain of Phe-tRNA-synthetase-like protein